MRCIYSRSLAFDEFRSLAAHLIRRHQADLLLSGPGYPGEQRYYAGVEPSDELLITKNTRKEDMARFAFSSPGPAYGFLSYPFGLSLRDVNSRNSSYFPMGLMRKYKYYIKYDAVFQNLEIRSPVDLAVVDPDIATFPQSTDCKNVRPVDVGAITQSLNRHDYIDRVQKTLSYIRDGYIYQINLSIMYSAEAPGIDIAGMFLDLWNKYPAPFYAWFKAGRYLVFSTSPERFLKVERGRVVSEPIKGTLSFERYSPKLTSRLTESEKESAELSMIVDMIRNDISQNCRYGSVQVRQHKSVFVVDSLLQMFSKVIGTLREDKTVIDLLLDAFPGGSVTGCPKRKALAIIDDLEPHARDIYCGTFFKIEDEATMDSSIAIRTGYYDSEARRLCFYAGSGIVADSVPEREYEETKAKAGKFLKILEKA